MSKPMFSRWSRSVLSFSVLLGTSTGAAQTATSADFDQINSRYSSLYLQYLESEKRTAQDLAPLNAQASQVQNDLNRAIRARQAAESEVLSLRSEKAGIPSQIQSRRQEIETLRQDLIFLAGRLNLPQRPNDPQEIRRILNDQIAFESGRLSRLDSERAAAQSDYDFALSSRDYREIYERLQRTQENIARLTNQIDNLERQIRQTRERNEKLQTEIPAKKTQLQQLRASLPSLEQEIVKMRAELEKAKADLIVMEQEASVERAKLEALKTQMQTLREEFQQARRDRNEARIQELRPQIENLEREIRAQDKITEDKDEKVEWQKHYLGLIKLQKRERFLGITVGKKARAGYNKYNEAVKDAVDELADAQRQIQQLERQIPELEREVPQLTQKLRDLRQEREQTTQQLEQVQRRNADAQRDMDQFMARRLGPLQDRLNRLDLERQQLVSQIESLRSSLNTVDSTLERIRSLRSRIQDLQAREGQLESLIPAAEARVEPLRQAELPYQQLLADLNGRIRTIRLDLENLKVEINTLKKQGDEIAKTLTTTTSNNN